MVQTVFIQAYGTACGFFVAARIFRELIQIFECSDY